MIDTHCKVYTTVSDLPPMELATHDAAGVPRRSSNGLLVWLGSLTRDNTPSKGDLSKSGESKFSNFSQMLL